VSKNTWTFLLNVLGLDLQSNFAIDLKFAQRLHSPMLVVARRISAFSVKLNPIKNSTTLAAFAFHFFLGYLATFSKVLEH
jgi:hypothetical protein